MFVRTSLTLPLTFSYRAGQRKLLRAKVKLRTNRDKAMEKGASEPPGPARNSAMKEFYRGVGLLALLGTFGCTFMFCFVFHLAVH